MSIQEKTRLPLNALATLGAIEGDVIKFNGTDWGKSQIASGGLTNEVAFYQNAGGNLEEVSSGQYKVPTGSSFTLANGKTFTRNDTPLIDFASRPDGDYYVFVGESGGIGCIIEPTTYLTISKEEPTSPLSEHVWFNPYSVPYTSKTWNGSAWVDFPYALSNTIVTVDSSATPIVAFPLMTGENLPSGQYSSASSITSANAPSWKAFDGDVGSSWTTQSMAGPHSLTRWADTAVTANAVYLSSQGSDGTYSFGSFTLKGSNDGVSWTDIQTYTDLPTQYGGLTLLFPKSTYKYFKIDNAFARGADAIWMIEVSYRLIQPYNTTDLGNRTSYTESFVGGMPSNRYIDLTLGASGATYTMPANGWIVFDGTNSESHWQLNNQTRYMTATWTYAQSVYAAHGFLPVMKGDVVEVNYNSNKPSGSGYFRFVYAEGENV